MNNQNNVDSDLLKEKNKNNVYATQKSISQNLLNTAIFQNYIAILIYIFARDDDMDGWDITTVTLIVCAMLIQILTFGLLIWLITMKTDQKTFKYLKAKYVNSFIMFLSGISLLLNIAITALYSQIQLG